jgi:hypothetical protein
LENLVCPAQFERATYALEALKMRLINSLDNDISLARTSVQSAPRSVESCGIDWLASGIGRCGVGRTDTTASAFVIAQSRIEDAQSNLFF